MIKRLTLLWTAFMFLLAPLQLLAQSTLTEIETLGVEIWPDYDDTAVLVLFTGFLPANTNYPVTFTLPLPENAEVNAVAYITAENLMTDQDVDYEIEGNELTLTSSNPGFRIEFYIPYSVDGSDREFSYTWQSTKTAVNDLRVLIQQPISASELTTVPQAATIAPGNDGLTYHTTPSQTLAAGESFTIDVSYSMSSPDLTANLLNNQTAVTTESPSTTNTQPTTVSTDLNWPLILAGLGFFLIVIAGVWQLATKRATHKPTKPQKQKSAKTSTAKTNFCRECGTKQQPHDKFCRDCGTAVKQK